MKKRPITTLFMLMSVDGKISTGSSDELDVDKDFPMITGLKEGLPQYYEIEQTTDLWSLNSGRVQAKMGVNEKELPDKRLKVSFVVLDNSHLTTHGVDYFTHLSKTFVLVTSNSKHPAFNINSDNLNILLYDKLDARIMLEDLYEQYGCHNITIQTGGTLNSVFLKSKLFDYVDIVMAPVLIGGKDTPTLIDGVSLEHTKDLWQLGVLSLQNVELLKDSYIRLRYKIMDNPQTDSSML